MSSAAPDSSPSPSETAGHPASPAPGRERRESEGPEYGSAKEESAANDAPPPDDRAGALPDRFADEAMQQLEPSIRTIWTLKLGAGLLVLVGAVFFYDLVQWLSGGPGGWGFLRSGGLAVVAVAATVAVPRLRYRYWRYALRTEELYLERGIFNRVRTIVPLRRIQHLDVSQDLFEREFSLGKLIVHTAGGRSSNVAVPGLRYETAERLRDDVKRYVLDDAV